MTRLDVEFGSITADNIEHLRRINGASFPIVYNQAYYKDLLDQDDASQLNQFAFYKGQIVGAICAVLQDIAAGDQHVYIRTLAVLAAYRGRGIGSQLMERLLHYCEQRPSVMEVSLHVQISNDDAIDFYTNKFQFTKGELVENYYRRVDPPHCYRLYRVIRKGDSNA
ncbi:hypothetical protein FisN_14Hh259 [Fistulifera solaris]|uniref:N-acetyltransferase domain-containing protein n=1 Tax=Fistulifera solaris TaxID=1519565 RepID=A0A1Z5KB95_FISSO|nr:hypothetical protein FisN_14Hh259 [Fistulifera solaris]|eukprot:GAX23563.1 hypothetical protein FisN_14Hh259 [Fistulifera solaris]